MASEAHTGLNEPLHAVLAVARVGRLHETGAKDETASCHAVQTLACCAG